MSNTDNSRLDRSSRICRRPTVLATEVEGEVVIMDIEKGLYFGLDAIGTYIWKRLETPMSVSELAPVLRKRYAADMETIERDVLVLMSKLVEQGLVEVCV